MEDTLQITINKTLQSRVQNLDYNNIQFAREYSDHMLVTDFKGGEWENPEIIPYGNLSLSPANPAIHYGQSIFEGLKAYKHANGKISIFRPKANYNRMNVSAKRMVMPHIPEEIFMDGLTELLRLDQKWVPDVDGTSLYIRPFLFATDEFIGVRPSQDYKFMIITTPVGAYYSKPVKVKVETHYTRAVKGGTGYAKTAGNYAASLYPAMLAQKDGYDQLIWTDGQNHELIEESGTMNIMFILNDALVTAPTGDTILDGITRDSVLTLAKDWGMKVEERPLSVKEMVEGLESGALKEAFGVGTAATIAHIEVIASDGIDYKLDESGRVFSQKMLKALTDIRLGLAEDKFGWNYYI
ncbi:MAG: branched-chain amino acid aminotransferase [Cyclobacteriaceae bacterium]|nr:branched-chain amino acid aminotransferase [Cyclobacteriaceae bacterium]